jgi:hypothetical protein
LKTRVPAPIFDGAVRDPELTRLVNDRIRDVALALTDIADMPAAFMCECGCRTAVGMTVGEYDDVAAHGVWVNGHQPVREGTFRRSDGA